MPGHMKVKYESQNTGEDTEHSLNHQHPSTPPGGPGPGDNGEHAVHERVGSEQEDQRREGDAWQEEGPQPEQHGDQAAQRQRPSVLRERG